MRNYLKGKMTRGLDRLAEGISGQVAERLAADQTLASTLADGVMKHVAEQLAGADLAKHVAERLATNARFADEVAYGVALESLLHSAKKQTPFEVFRNVSDDFWFWVNTAGVARRSTLRDLLPGMPSPAVQELYTGQSGMETLTAAFEAYQMFKQFYQRHQKRELADCEAILDFGCGWGRILRFFLKDLEPSRLYGGDPVPEMIDLCHQTYRVCQFDLISTEPPTHYPDNKFDLIYCFSVFSHLSEDFHQNLLVELRRILKPGGLLMATTRAREFIADCVEDRKNPNPESLASGVAYSLASFLDPEEALHLYDRGEYCFSSLADSTNCYYWGDAAISEAYVHKHWSKVFTVVDYVNDRNLCTQNLIIVRKERAA